MFDADRTHDELMQDLRTCIERTNMQVAEHDGKFRFGFPPPEYADSDPTEAAYYSLSDEFTAIGMREARAFALGVRAGARRGGRFRTG